MLEKQRRELNTILRYATVSVLALIVDLSCFACLAIFLHILLAAAISFIVGTCFKYVLSIGWVFMQRRQHTFRFEFGAFFLIGVGGLLLQSGILYVLDLLWNQPPLYFKIVASGFLFLWGYCARRYILF
ncbi:MAG: GtrA family protein [Myxococcota bacterium]